MEVLEEKSVAKYLQKHPFLLNQYKKAKEHMKSDNFLSILLKKRKPKSEGIYQFRISKKYRGLGYFRGEYFIITEINDHQ